MGQILLDLYVLWSTWNSYKQLHCDLVQRFIALDVCRCCIVFVTVAAAAAAAASALFFPANAMFAVTTILPLLHFENKGFGDAITTLTHTQHHRIYLSFMV